MKLQIKNRYFFLPMILIFLTSCQFGDDIAAKIRDYNAEFMAAITVAPTPAAIYNNDELKITITGSDPDITIKYTIGTVDGNLPSRTNGTEYTGPFTVTTPAGLYYIKAVQYNSSKVSDVTTKTAILGDGSASYPYEIATAAQLKKVSDNVTVTPIHNNRIFLQIANISLSDPLYSTTPGWVPIGNNPNQFTGTYDGGNFLIENLTINRNVISQGLFGEVSNGTLKNIKLQNVNITGQQYTAALAARALSNTVIINCTLSGTSSISGTGSVGGIAGTAVTATITDCTAAATINGTVNYIGGIAGNINATKITNCHTNVTVNGAETTGGLIGFAVVAVTLTQTISGCTSAGSVNGTDGVGGLVGITGSAGDNGIHIFSSSSTASVKNTTKLTAGTGDSIGVGGLVGALLYGGEITNCHASGYVENYATAGQYRETGGLVGAIIYSPSTITNSHATGEVYAPNATRVGGFAGFSQNSAIIGSGNYSTGRVDGNNCVGGFIGYNANANISSNNYATGNVSGSSIVGGFSGWNGGYINDAGDPIGCWHTSGTITGNTGSGIIGGFSGNNTPGARIKNCYAKGNVIVNTTGAGSNAGGFIGLLNGGTIERCFARGNVTNSLSASFTSIGGFAGAITSGSTTDSYSTGDVQSIASTSGGFTGSNAGTITNCYSTGNVTGSGGQKGGFVGDANSGTYADCFWLQDGLINTSPFLYDDGTILIDYAAIYVEDQTNMKVLTTFTSAGWLAGTWHIDPIVNSGYPHLAWE